MADENFFADSRFEVKYDEYDDGLSFTLYYKSNKIAHCYRRGVKIDKAKAHFNKAMNFEIHERTIVFPHILWMIPPESILDMKGELVQHTAKVMRQTDTPYDSHHNHVGRLSHAQSLEFEHAVCREVALNE